MSAGDEVVAALRRVVADLGGDTRAGQEEMARLIAEAIHDGTSLAVQAGTGTGKSLAYLVPAVLTARDDNRRVVIATSTLGLQRQLAERDLPRTLTSLGAGEAVHSAVLKGRQNYICLNRLHADVPEDDALFDVEAGNLARQVRDVREWAESTDTGDRDDYPDEIDARVWRSLSVTSRECVGESACRFSADCFSARKRSDAMDADIVITNHALVAINSTGDSHVLPEHDVLILDEAHDFIDRVTSAVTAEFDVAQVRRLLGRLGARVDDDVRLRAQDALGAVENALDASTVGRVRVIRPDLLLSLTQMRDIGHAILGSLAGGEELVDSRLRAGIQEFHDAAARALESRDDEVVWIEESAAGRSLHVAPLDVGAVVREALPTTTIATSATLPMMDAESIGLPESTSVVDVGSPFDFPRQGILYVAEHLPPPGRDGVPMESLDEMAELIQAAGGRTLGLFSSWRGVDRASEYLRVRLPGITVLAQQRGESPARVIREFSDDERSVLLGTVSLWQGIDVPGRSCILVVIDRLPFPRPDDPVISARAERAEAAGGSGFMDVSVPRAALLLAQGAGRLIRGHGDRGVVAVLDPRLVSARYGSVIRASMPALWLTTDRAVALGALERLASNAELD